jgi:hypothetical protein
MVASTAELSTVDYARSIVLSLYPMLDRVEWRMPLPPDSCVWRGEAQSQYARQLSAAREATAVLRMHLDRALDAMQAVGSCG